jgi:hypothetical protein
LAAAVRAGETALAGDRAADITATAAAAADHQRCVAWADHEAAAAASTTAFITAGAADGDLQRLPWRSG